MHVVMEMLKDSRSCCLAVNSGPWMIRISAWIDEDSMISRLVVSESFPFYWHLGGWSWFWVSSDRLVLDQNPIDTCRHTLKDKNERSRTGVEFVHNLQKDRSKIEQVSEVMLLGTWEHAGVLIVQFKGAFLLPTKDLYSRKSKDYPD